MAKRAREAAAQTRRKRAMATPARARRGLRAAFLVTFVDSVTTGTSTTTAPGAQQQPWDAATA